MKNTIVLMLILLAMAATAIAQPAVQSGRAAANTDTSDRPQIDVESYSVDITITPNEHKLQGTADIQFKQLDRRSFATFDLDRRLRVTNSTIGGIPAQVRQFDLDSTIEVNLSGQQFTGSPVLHIEYSGVLEPDEDRRDPVFARVSEDSAFLLYEGKWFPTNGLYKDKATMRLRVRSPQGWSVVSDLAPSG